MTKLNLGAGGTQLEGYESIDRANGREVFPLDVPDGSVEEIYASHVLEHFPHGQVSQVLNHWATKLIPGGRLRVAVPDFKWIAQHYLDGEVFNIQGYVAGGQTDENDYHKTVFDEELLTDLLAAAGLERIGRWQPEIQDCASLDVSLNLCGYKPLSTERIENVLAVLSAPRFGPVMHMRCAFTALSRINVPYCITQGAYWHQILCEALEDVITRPEAEYVLAVDYDTIFDSWDVVNLYRLARAFPEADAICPVQSKRGSAFALFGMRDRDGMLRTRVNTIEFARRLVPVDTGHFGLTLIRVASLRQLPRPWMLPRPNDEGRWTEGKVDADIYFWHHWKTNGFSLHLAPSVVIGHLEEVIAWPDQTFQTHYQTTEEFNSKGRPDYAAGR